MRKNQITRKSILIHSSFFITLVFAIILIVNCSQPFSFSDVLNGSEDSEGGVPGSFPDIDYIVDSISNSPSSVDVNTSLSQSFDIRNQGIDTGANAVYWTAYLSVDQILDGGDTPLNSGSISALQGESNGDLVSITGLWPVSAGVYYIIVNVSAGDDIDPFNNYLASDSFTIITTGTDIDYFVNNISRDYPTVTSGSLCSETFDFTNIGGGDGALGDDISWTAWSSDDNSLGDDTEIGSGILSALDAGFGYLSVPISGTWPSTAGDYYILIDFSAPNEDISENNTTYNGPYTVKDPPDYSIISPSFLTEGSPRTILSSTSSDYQFEIIEIDNNDGSEQIAWEVFASTNANLDGSDFPLKSDTLLPFAAGASSGLISFADIDWPNFGSYYYIIISISAGDDSNLLNNTFVSPIIFVPEYYLEDGDINSDVGPTSGSLSLVSDLGSTLQNSLLNVDELIKVEGLKDATGQYDTYKFEIDSSVTSVDIQLEWTNGLDAFDFYFWGEDNSETPSISASEDIEPAAPPKTISGLTPGNYYIGVKSLGLGTLGDTYTLIINGRE